MDGSAANRNPTMPMHCVDLFAGAGGFSLAARRVGLTVVAAVEFNKHAASTYRRNFCSANGSTRLYESNILELEPKELAADLAARGVPCDVLLGGPPCQGFSVHRIRGAGVDDPRNNLILRYFEFVAVLRPKFFLIENVPGILWSRHKHFLDRLYFEASRAGYKIEPPAELDARNFGVPQRRKRIFILGYNGARPDGLVWPIAPTHGDSEALQKNTTLTPWMSAETVFGPTPNEDPNNVHMQHHSTLVEVFRNTPLDGGSRNESGRILPCHRLHDGHKDVYGRVKLNSPGPTMTTACINPSKGRFVHPLEHHGITLRQAARFQTFPDDFVFEGGLIAGGQQIGNAVPIELATKILLELSRSFLQTADQPALS